MGKSLIIAEKNSVAGQFADALKVTKNNRGGYYENDQYVVTWCVGHLVTLCMPEDYDQSLKKWSMDTLPIIHEPFKYKVKDDTVKQFNTVSALLNRSDVETIYVATDSGREGEYIYRLVAQESHVTGKAEKRVWINSQTDEEILRGIREAKDISEYNNISDSAYLRAKEDYLMGINFSRALSVRYSYDMASALGEKYVSIAVGRVMTCVLGMIVKREREIRDFKPTAFYRVVGTADLAGVPVELEWKAVEGSKHFDSPVLYKENGFKEEKDAKELIEFLQGKKGVIASIDKKKETKPAPLLYNLADLQTDCSKMFKITPEETLGSIQRLYEAKLCTYPRTDARVLSTAVCKEITKNISGLAVLQTVKPFVDEIMTGKLYEGIAKTKYCDDKKITDHYAVIPTGQGFNALKTLSKQDVMIFEVIVRRFLSIFYPAAIYEKLGLDIKVESEHLFAGQKYLKDPGYMKVTEYSFKKKKDEETVKADSAKSDAEDADNLDENIEENNAKLGEVVSKIKKNDEVEFLNYEIKEGETSAPKRYTSGTIIRAMEGAGKMIEDEDLRAQIKGSGIGTSATRGGIIEKLTKNNYIKNNKKTQVLSPTLMGEMINDVVATTVPQLLVPELTASWEKGLTQVAEGTIPGSVYMDKLKAFIIDKTNETKNKNNREQLKRRYQVLKKYY